MVTESPSQPTYPGSDGERKDTLQRGVSRPFMWILALVCLLTLAAPPRADSQTGDLSAKWNQGSTDCARNPGPPLEIHHYDSHTLILREGLCTTGEAPFMYLLIGTKQALLIDTGDVEDPKQVALAMAVMAQLPTDGSAKLPLLVAHTHRHQDHRAGDPQFATVPNARVVGFDLDSVKKFYHFAAWPNGSAQIDLGDRTIDVIPTPGHNETEVTFYDRNTTLVFSGDFLLPGRVLVDDTNAYRLSAARLIQFLHGRPVAAFLGGHVEKNSQGQLYDWQSSYHPDEHTLQLPPAALPALSEALGHFNGFYTVYGEFTMENSIRILIAVALCAVLILIGVIWLIVRSIRRYLRNRRSRSAVAAT